MKLAIVTTTINEPTKALHQFAKIAKRNGWTLIIVGDKKTPPGAYDKFTEDYKDHVVYMSPAIQDAIDMNLSELIGWNCIQRRNFGFIYAYRQGFDVIATVDDDNIPNKDWGSNCVVGRDRVLIDDYNYKPDVPNDYIVFDPLAATNQSGNIWHRGFPIQLLKHRTRLNKTTSYRQVLVQADLWNGDPDVDAICRIAKSPNVKFSTEHFYGSNLPGPFNSQNTFLHRSVIPDYFLFPHIGRMDDIWASYFLQRKHPNSVVYGPASVFQDRNEHNLLKDLEAEMIGYQHSLDFASWCFSRPGEQVPDYMPKESIRAFDVYRGLINAKD